MDADKPPTDPRPPCEICGSTEHTAGHHDGAEPPGYHHGGPPNYATEVVHVDDDDRADS